MEDGLKSGYGVYNESDGFKFEGMWVNDMREGRGTLTEQ